MESAIQSWGTFTYNFGPSRSLEEVGEENVKETISNYFDNRIDAHLVEFLGNKTPPSGDIMKVRVKARDGYGIIDELAGERIQMDGDDYVYIIQGGRDTGTEKT